MISVALFFLSQLTTVVLSFTYMPIMAFVGYQLVYFLYHDSRWWISSVPDLRYSFFFSVLVLLFAMFTRARGEGLKVFASPSFRWLWVLVAIFAAMYPLSLSPSLHLTALEHYVKSVAVASAALVLCKDRQSLDYIIGGYVAGATYIGYYILEVGRNSGNRVDGIGTVDSPEVNGLAAMLVPAAIFALHYFWASSKLSHRAMVVVAGALITNALVLMNSRGAYLGLAFGAAYYMFRLYSAKLDVKHLKLKVIATGLVGVVALFSIMDQSAIDRIFSIREESSLTTERQTGSTRVFFWMAAVRMAKDNPLGQGAYAFHINSDLYIPEEIDTGGSRRRAPHSTWFQTLCEVGFLGISVFLLVLWSTYSMLAKCRKALRLNADSRGFFVVVAIEAACVGYLLSMTFIDRMRAEALHWLILFGAAAYQLYLLNESKETHEQLDPSGASEVDVTYNQS